MHIATQLPALRAAVVQTTLQAAVQQPSQCLDRAFSEELHTLLLLLFFWLLACLRGCLQVIVMGIPTVERAVINKNKDNSYNLLVEGTGLQVNTRVTLIFLSPRKHTLLLWLPFLAFST
jgi:hypothetical protein